MRKFLRFNISILKEPNKVEGKSRGFNPSSSTPADREARSSGCINKFATNYMVSLQLVRGTPIVFLDFAHHFFNMIAATIDMQRAQLKELGHAHDARIFDLVLIR